MASGFRSAQHIPLGLAQGPAPAVTASVRNLLAFWMGGAGAPPGGATPDGGMHSLVAFWMGGAGSSSGAVSTLRTLAELGVGS